MAYGLKYKAEWKNTKGQYYRLQIYQRDFSGGSTTIGDLCGCLLEVQGNMGSIITPIIKTQLRFMVVDAPDEPTAGTGKKFGNWQEFFTPDATLYKVVLGQSTNQGSSYTDIWSGYITPDSWVEDLGYRGVITITARDGIGHLKDFQFSTDGWTAVDENGLVALKWLWDRAGTIIDFPMTLSIEEWDLGHGGPYAPEVPIENDYDVTLVEASVNVALFEGMNWYDVLEQSLEAAGYVLRYVGNNKCQIACLRNLPKMGNYTAATGTQALEFYGGTMELDPAVKKIEEVQDYKQQSELMLEPMKGLEYGNDTTYRCKIDGNTLPAGGVVHVPEHDAPMNPVTAGGQTGWEVGSGMLNPDGYLPDDFLKRAEGEEGWKQYAMIACNQVLNSQGTSPTATYIFSTRTAAVKLTFRFTPNPLTIRHSGSMTGKISNRYFSLANIKYYVMFSDGTTTKYWNGASWVAEAVLLEKEYDAQNQYETDFVLELAECEDIDVGDLYVRFGQIIYNCWSSAGDGCYARVQEIRVEINATTVLESNKVTTINNDAYNVMLSRKPLFGALSKEMSFVRPSNYLAGLFLYPYYGSNPMAYPYKVRFTDQLGAAAVPLPVLIHEQIMCYYYGAARVLNGAAAITGNALFAFNKICTYKGHNYLFQGGTLDLFSGIINSACFREYIDYDELWDGTPPSYSEDVKYNN